MEKCYIIQPLILVDFNFSLDNGQIISGFGGDSESAGFSISTSGTTLLGFSLTGASFGPCGTLINLDIEGQATSLEDIVFSSINGEPLLIDYYQTPIDDLNLVTDCSDEYPDCAANAFDCAGECGGSAVEDECGVCDGDGIADGACDGNVDLGCGCVRKF